VTRGYARYVLAVMVAINFLNYMDRWVAAAASPIIQKEFGLSDTLIGLLGSAFLLVYAVSALPFGYWADRGVRKVVIGVGVTIWSIATLFTGFSRNFAHLFISRSVLGIGEAGYYPAGTSLLSDWFPKEQRGRVMSIWAPAARSASRSASRVAATWPTISAGAPPSSSPPCRACCAPSSRSRCASRCEAARKKWARRWPRRTTPASASSSS